MLSDFKTALRPALVLAALFAVLLGLLYPTAITVLGQLLFPHQANGSLVREDGRVIGSELIGQSFAGAPYFRGRPSAAGAEGYDATASAGSNLGPTSRALIDRVRAERDGLQAQSPRMNVPPDLVTASASGLDPHISPEAALFQVERVAQARDMAPAAVRDLVEQQVEGPLFGFLGEPRVNVLALNRELDRISGRP